ncbi:MAG: hypothetical protein MUF31_16250 [Akkermansiaceae bacterium]|jgi:ferric-dicitrate binding protein FerR (iron transport regulator)|nr:hypothetical protein [Akkermansiaceae bacterium]
MSRRSDEEMIQAAFDGQLDPRGFADLEDRLRREPTLRSIYRRYSRLTLALEEKFAHSEPNVIPLASARPRPRRHGAWLALAACATGLLALPFIPRTASGHAVAFGPESHGRLVSPTAAADSFRLVPGSRIELEHGSVSIDLGHGARAYLEGPGLLEFPETGRFELVEGRLWLNVPAAAGLVRCSTSGLSATTADGQFGMIASRGPAEEIHVLRGSVQLTQNRQQRELSAGHSATWDGLQFATIDRAGSFSTHFPHLRVLFDEDFNEPALTPLAGKMPDIGVGPWSVDRGGPIVENGVLDTSGNVRHAAFAPLDTSKLDDLSHILLLTLESSHPETCRFHSEGWAGVSLYTGEEERIFIGDPCGPERGWALHPTGYDARHACPLLQGETTVTLRYDFRSGLAQLFQGTNTSGPALASEWISPGLRFDRLRIANGSQADAAVDAGKPASAAGTGPDVNVRGDIALRRIRVSVLSSETADAFEP